MNRSVVQYMTENDIWNKLKNKGFEITDKAKGYLHDKRILTDKKRDVLESRKRHLEWQKRNIRPKDYSGRKGIGVVPGDMSTNKYMGIES
jgi:hypothetical protein